MVDKSLLNRQNGILMKQQKVNCFISNNKTSNMKKLNSILSKYIMDMIINIYMFL